MINYLVITGDCGRHRELKKFTLLSRNHKQELKPGKIIQRREEGKRTEVHDFFVSVLDLGALIAALSEHFHWKILEFGTNIKPGFNDINIMEESGLTKTPNIRFFF